MYQQLIETGTVNRNVVDFATFRDADLRSLDYNKSALTPFTVSAGQTVVAGDLVTLVAPVAGAPGVGYPLSIRAMPASATSDADHFGYVGVALQGATAGSVSTQVHPAPTIQVATSGTVPTKANAAITNAQIGQRVISDAVAGQGINTGIADATSVVGRTFGIWMSARNGATGHPDNGRAWMRIRRQL